MNADLTRIADALERIAAALERAYLPKPVGPSGSKPPPPPGYTRPAGVAGLGD